jgi:tetratricopeptide (TPR) repeat protein
VDELTPDDTPTVASKSGVGGAPTGSAPKLPTPSARTFPASKAAARSRRRAWTAAGIGVLLLMAASMGVLGAHLISLTHDRDRARAAALVAQDGLRRAGEAEAAAVKERDAAIRDVAREANLRERADADAEAARTTARQVQEALEATQLQRQAALEVIRTLTTQVATQLRDRPGMERVRQAMLDAAVAGLQEVDRAADTKDLPDRSLAGMHQRIGQALLAAGDSDGAIRQYEIALERLEKLAAREPDDPIVSRNMVATLNNLADVAMAGRGSAEQARAYARRALRLRLDRLRNEPDNGALNLDAAGSYALVAGLSMRLGDSDSARADTLRALELRDSLPAPMRGRLDVQRDQAAGLDRLGEIALRRGDSASAHTQFDKAYTLRKGLVRRDPDKAGAGRELVRSLNNLGDVALTLDRDPGRAKALYAEALELCEVASPKPDPRPAGDEPSPSLALFGAARLALRAGEKLGPESLRPRFGEAARDVDRVFRPQELPDAAGLRCLAATTYRLAIANLKLGDPARAEILFDRCLQARRLDPPGPGPGRDPGREADLLLALARCGKLKEAGRVSAELAGAPGLDAEGFYKAAEGYAQCAAAAMRASAPSESERYTKLALGALGRAVDLGWKDAPALVADPELEPIRDRPGFQDLLERIKLVKRLP